VSDYCPPCKFWPGNFWNTISVAELSKLIHRIVCLNFAQVLTGSYRTDWPGLPPFVAL
jgi:hypothetical protein